MGPYFFHIIIIHLEKGCFLTQEKAKNLRLTQKVEKQKKIYPASFHWGKRMDDIPMKNKKIRKKTSFPHLSLI